MFNWLIRNRIDAFERRWNYDSSYARELLAASPAALMAFAKATRLGQFREHLPKDVWHAARLVGILHEDCGACAQLTVQMAEADRVDPSLLGAVATGEIERLPDAVRLAVRFCRASLRHEPEADDLRPQVVQRFGRPGLATLALTLAATRLYPTVKYALGHGHACRALSVGGKRVPPFESTSPLPNAPPLGVGRAET